MKTAASPNNAAFCPNGISGQKPPHPAPCDTRDGSAADGPPARPELTKVLRWGGGAVLTAAAIVFMCQGVSSFDPMTRHWIMLAVCALLGLMGIVTGLGLKEEKGARAFLGFAAAFFPVLASQLGAMFFSLFGRPPLDMPQPLVFSLVGLSKVLAVTGLTLAVAVTVSSLAFRVLARPRAGLLTLAFTLANLSILLPVREGVGLGAVIALAALGIYLTDTQLRRDFRLDCFEGRSARLILTGPLWVLTGRTFFYPVGPGLYGLLLALAGAYLAFHWGMLAPRDGQRKVCQAVGFIGLSAGWLVSLLPILESSVLSEGPATYLILLPVAAILVALSLVSEGLAAGNYRSFAATVATFSVIIAHGVEATPLVSIIGVMVAVAVVSAGTLAGEKLVFILGLLTALLSLGNILFQAVRLHGSYTWVALAAIGIGVMFSASLIDKGLARSLKKTSMWGRWKTRTV